MPASIPDGASDLSGAGVQRVLTALAVQTAPPAHGAAAPELRPDAAGMSEAAAGRPVHQDKKALAERVDSTGVPGRSCLWIPRD